jgi:transposase
VKGSRSAISRPQLNEETHVKLHSDIDLHSNNNAIVLLDVQDRIVYQKWLPNDLNHILQQLAPYHDAIQGLVVESTYNWSWLVDGLMEAGYRVHLANTAAIHPYYLHGRHLGIPPTT